MRRGPILPLLAVLVVACSSQEGATTSTAPEQTQPEETFVPVYRYEAGDHYDYGFTLTQRVDMQLEGDETLLGGDAPGDVDVNTDIRGTISYDISAGPDPGTVRLAVSGVFDQIDIAGTVDGEEVTDGVTGDGTVPDLIQVPDVVLVLDQLGEVVSIGGAAPGETPFFGDPFTQLGDLTSGGLGNHFGPTFPDRPLRTGDTWSYDRSVEGVEIETRTSYEVRGIETIGGKEVIVIDFVTDTSEVEIDLGEMFRGLFGEQAPGDTAEVPDVQLLITVAPSRATGTIWFDAVAGVSERFEQASATVVDMVMDLPGSDGPSRATVHLDVDMELSAELRSGGNA